MRKGELRRIVLLAATAATLAGCAGTQEAPVPAERQPVQPQPGDANVPGLVGEMRDPRTRAKAHTELAAAYYGIGNYGVALEEARIALAADSSFAPAYNVQGLVYMDLKDNAQAEASFQRGLRLTPQDPDLNHNYGWFLCRTGREPQSIQWFLNAIRDPLYTTPAKSFAAAGRCSVTHDPKAAAEYFERALRLDPNNLSALIAYSELQYRNGRLGEAKTLITRYNRLLPEPTADSLWLALRIERKLGDRAAETNLATQLRRRYPGSPEVQALQRGEFD